MDTKKEFYVSMRKKWAESKGLIARYSDAFKVAAAQGVEMSPTSFCFVAHQMEALGLDGYPGVDAKTFGKWKEAGFIVKKGEHSQLNGVVWLPVSKKTDEGEKGEEFMMPKAYNLFHKSQVKPIE